jgi:zinc transport system permease protein
LLEFLSYNFIQNAFLAAVLVSFITAIVGSLIIVNRLVFLAGGIAHTSYGGIGIAIFFGLPIFLSATLFSICASLVIAYIALKQKDQLDVFIGLVWAVGMALGIILIDLTPGYNVDLLSYLFGSILAVTNNDLLYMCVLLVVIAFIVSYKYKNILAVSYDSEFASLQGININFYYTLILVLSALSIVVAIKIVGLILVIALLTIPIYIASNFANSLFSMMIISALLSSCFSIIGLVLSYIYDLTSGATIILVSAVFLILFKIVFRNN